MRDALFTMLTDEKARTAEAVEAELDENLALGAAWFYYYGQNETHAADESFDLEELLRR